MTISIIKKVELYLILGDVIEITGSTDSGLLEGTLRGQTGLFPRHLVQEVRFRAHKDVATTGNGAPAKPAITAAAKEEVMSPKEVVKSKQPQQLTVAQAQQHFATVSSKGGLNFVPGMTNYIYNQK